MKTDLSAFVVAGYDDDGLRFTEPVLVRCIKCGDAARFGEFAGSAADSGASLKALTEWARNHRCPPARPAPVERRLVAA